MAMIRVILCLKITFFFFLLERIPHTNLTLTISDESDQKEWFLYDKNRGVHQLPIHPAIRHPENSVNVCS
jgi:hypothetical protein